MELKIPYIVKKGNGGYVIECIDLNIVTQGNSLEEARKNVREAIVLHLKSANELGMLNKELEKLGAVKKNNIIEIPKRVLETTPIQIPV